MYELSVCVSPRRVRAQENYLNATTELIFFKLVRVVEFSVFSPKEVKSSLCNFRILFLNRAPILAINGLNISRILTSVEESC